MPYIAIPLSPHYKTNRFKHLAKNVNPCVVCGKGISKGSKRQFWVRVVNGGSDLATPDMKVDPAGDLGAYPIGADCLRQHPELRIFVFADVRNAMMTPKRP